MNNFLLNFNAPQTINLVFKVVAILVSLFYLLYTIIVSRQVKEIGETLSQPFNQVLYFICSLQTTFALILIIFSLFLI